MLMLAAGSAFIAWSAHASSGRWTSSRALVVSGLGMA